MNGDPVAAGVWGKRGAPGGRAGLAALVCIASCFVLTGPVKADEAGSGELAGSVVRDEKGTGGVLVEIHLEARGGGDRTPFAAAESAEDGSFLFSLPPGAYYLAAKLPSPGPGPPVVIEHPDSPFTVQAAQRLEVSSLDLAGGGGYALLTSGVKGRILLDGKPAPGGSVTIYDAKVRRPVGPRYASRVESGPDGRFEAPVPPGSYLVAVRIRQRGVAFGPPQPGDLAAEYGKNPVTVEEGRFADTGDIELHEVDTGKLQRRLGSLDSPVASTISISGKVADSEGKFIDGAFVFLYGNAEMTGPPLLVTRSGEGGSFLLNPPAAGQYYIMARRTYGTARVPGEHVGLIIDSPDSSIIIAQGETLTGVLVRMREKW